MKQLEIIKPTVEFRLIDYHLTGAPIINQTRKLKDLSKIFKDVKAFYKMDSETLTYTVQAWQPIPEGTPGGLFFGTSTIMPGKVGDEYFMTKGHFHAQSQSAEFYWGVRGKGTLILMDRTRKTWAEEIYPVSLHYIGAHIAHRLANTGIENLIVSACWPSDAGHDYEEIAVNGFSARLLEINGNAVLVESNDHQ
jgi:glucose-6-phosphate isomerase